MIKDIKISENRGSGLGVILYGVTLLLILIFTAINIVNSKVIESGYSSLRDAVQTASSGAVMHLLTTDRTTAEGATTAQSKVISDDKYDVYLQLALGYLINRNTDSNTTNDSYVQSGEINNFIKLDHQKVVNTTLALLQDAVARRKVGQNGQELQINNTAKYQIMMFFIEPYQDSAGQKFFNIIAYGNGDYKNGNITDSLAIYPVKVSGASNMKQIYVQVESAINSIVNCEYNFAKKNQYPNNKWSRYDISLNASGSSNYNQLVREMETYPHYLIVVKDFALPTIFDGQDTDTGFSIKRLFQTTEARLKSPMCALNTGKIQRQVEEAGWSQKR